MMDNHIIPSPLNKAVIRERYKQAVPLFEAFISNDVPFVVHKGAPLSKMIYGREYKRVSGDIDLLVPREEIDRAKLIMQSHGFVQGKLIGNRFVPADRQELVFHMAHTHQTMPFYKETDNKLCPYVCIDVNMDIYWGESGKQTDMMDFLSDRETLELIERVTVPVLPAEKAFLAMCLHHYKDMHSIYLLYSRNGFPLSHLDDISEFIRNVPFDNKKLVSLACKYEAGKYIYCCLDTSERVLGALPDHSLKDLLHQPKYENEYFSMGLTENELKEWPYDPATIYKTNIVRSILEKMLSHEERKKILENERYMV